MVRRNPYELALAFFTSVTLAACGSSQSGPHPTGTTGPSPGFVLQMQNSAGCLDFVKVMQSLAGAKIINFSTKDFGTPPDGKPVSPYYNWSIASAAVEMSKTKAEDGESLRGELKKELAQAKQNGCQSITSVDDDGKPRETKILEASRTRIVVGQDNDTQVIYELTADNEMDTSQSFQFPISHPCGNPDQPLDETHISVTTEAMVWGDAPAIPPRSANFEKLIRQGETQGNAPNMGSDDDTYCKMVKPQ